MPCPDFMKCDIVLTNASPIDDLDGSIIDIPDAAATMTAVPTIVFIITRRQFVEGLARTELTW
jgi:hypothetical protein